MREHESGSARRDALRNRARVARERARARRRRTRTLGIAAVVVGGLAVAAVIAVSVAGSEQPSGPGPRNTASDGVLLRGSHGAIVTVRTPALPDGGAPIPTAQDPATTDITVYADYLCPYCNQFEADQMPQIRQWVRDGTATLELHPIALLDRMSRGSDYSTRSAAAAACVADHDPDAFLAFDTSLRAHQPSEGTRGLTDDRLVALAEQAGATDDDVAGCITRRDFAGWVADATDRAVHDAVPNSSLRGITGTPTVIVDGAQYDGSLTDAAAFAAFARQQGHGHGSS